MFELKKVFQYQFILELSTFEYGCLMGLHIKEEEETEPGMGMGH